MIRGRLVDAAEVRTESAAGAVQAVGEAAEPLLDALLERVAPPLELLDALDQVGELRSAQALGEGLSDDADALVGEVGDRAGEVGVHRESSPSAMNGSRPGRDPSSC